MTSVFRSIVIPIALGFGRVFLLTGPSPVLVDAWMPGNTAKIVSVIEGHGYAPEQVQLIVLTHVHSDHAGSLAELKARTGARVVVGRDDAEALRTGLGAKMNPKGFWTWLYRILMPPPNKLTFTGVEPDIIVDDELDLHPYGIAGKVISTPGHTPGSLSIILDDGEAIVGDLVMGSLMVNRTPAIAFWAADEAQSRASIAKVLSYRPKVIRSTHGGPFAPGQLVRLSH